MKKDGISVLFMVRRAWRTFSLLKGRPQVFTAKCSEPQAGSREAVGGGSGVASSVCLRTEICYEMTFVKKKM